MATALPLDAVRSIAQKHEYKEVKHNERSRVVIFQKNTTKINVYYTTGTVGTCLNHPRQGKTQLFRRGVSLHTLNEIFQNPRIHTGTGYQLRKNNMVWNPLVLEKSSDGDGRNDVVEEPECDLARRWRFICYTSTDLCHDDAEIETVVKFCKLWNDLEFEKGVDCKSIDNRRDGSGCTLSNCLLDAARDHHGAISWMANEGEGQSRVLDIESECICLCDVGVEFKRRFQAKIAETRRMLLLINAPIRREILIWFVGRYRAGNKLIGQDGTLWGRDDIADIHKEYSLQYYPKKLKLDMCHGVRN